MNKHPDPIFAAAARGCCGGDPSAVAKLTSDQLNRWLAARDRVDAEECLSLLESLRAVVGGGKSQEDFEQKLLRNEQELRKIASPEG